MQIFWGRLHYLITIDEALKDEWAQVAFKMLTDNRAVVLPQFLPPCPMHWLGSKILRVMHLFALGVPLGVGRGSSTPWILKVDSLILTYFWVWHFVKLTFTTVGPLGKNPFRYRLERFTYPLLPPMKKLPMPLDIPIEGGALLHDLITVWKVCLYHNVCTACDFADLLSWKSLNPLFSQLRIESSWLRQGFPPLQNHSAVCKLCKRPYPTANRSTAVLWRRYAFRHWSVCRAPLTWSWLADNWTQTKLWASGWRTGLLKKAKVGLLKCCPVVAT